MKTLHNSKFTAKLIIKYLKDELTEQEKDIFQAWLNADPKNQALLASFRDTATVQNEINFINGIDVNADWEAISKQTNLAPKHRARGNRLFVYSAAALLLITVSIGIYTYKIKSSIRAVTTAYDVMPGKQKAFLEMADGSAINLDEHPKQVQTKDGSAINTKAGILAFKANNNQSHGYNLLKTPKAGEYKMILPDGTQVWLNAASSLKFSTDFNKNERRVELKGEAYFEVAHNKTLPFTVHFNNTEVEVVGTHFNINSYGKKSKTTLIEGAIKITEGNDQKSLKPGDEAVTEAGKVDISKTETYKSIAWKEGVFYFNEDKMTDILDQVARWYNVEIIYNGSPSTKKYNGNIRRQATLNQVLEMLNAVSGTNFKLKDRTITVNF